MVSLGVIQLERKRVREYLFYCPQRNDDRAIEGRRKRKKKVGEKFATFEKFKVAAAATPSRVRCFVGKLGNFLSFPYLAAAAAF